MSKKSLIKIIITIPALAILLTAFIIWHREYSDQYDGTLSIELINLQNQQVSRKEISYQQGETLSQILQRNYEVRIENNFLYEIDELKTPSDWSSFICIYVNYQLSMVGINDIEFKDEDLLTFKMEVNSYA